MKFIDLIKQFAWQILAVIFLLLWLGQGCSNKQLAKTNKLVTENNTILVNKVDSLININVSKKEISDMMESTMWKFLELEELSDKNHIPINELKYKDKK